MKVAYWPVRPEGADHHWRKTPPGDLEADSGKSALDAVGVGAAAMLTLCVGSGSRHQELLRSNRFQAVDARITQAHELPMGAFVHRTLAASTRTDGGWER
jgi:hypothetical protein